MAEQTPPDARSDEDRTHEERRRRARLDEMTRRAVEDGLYEMTADDYRDALEQARHDIADGEP